MLLLLLLDSEPHPRRAWRCTFVNDMEAAADAAATAAVLRRDILVEVVVEFVARVARGTLLLVLTFPTSVVPFVVVAPAPPRTCCCCCCGSGGGGFQFG